MNIISKFLLIIFLFLLFETKSYSQASGDSTEITIDSITTKVEIFQNKISNSEISFIIDQIKVNNESIKIESKNKQSYNVKLNERDTLEMELSISSNNEIIFNYFFNDNQNYRVLNNGKIVYDKASKKIYFDFIPNNTQAQNKFITWNLFANNLSGGIAKYNLTIEITNLDYPPKILNKQIDKIIREKYIFDYIPIISDGDDGVLFSLETDAPINEFNPIDGKISWTIDPNEIKVLEKTFSFFMKVYKVNNPEKFDSDTFKIIYSEKNYAPVFGKTSKWIVEEGKYHEYKIPVEDPNVNDSFVIENV